MFRAYTFHHVGIAVPDLEKARAFYASAFGFETISGPFDDPIQKVKLCFVSRPDNAANHLELISPLGEESPVNTYLKQGIGAYHVCYEVPAIDEALAELRKNKCVIVSRPVPAVAFDGRKIAWLFTPTQQLIELLEQSPPKA